MASRNPTKVGSSQNPLTLDSDSEDESNVIQGGSKKNIPKSYPEQYAHAGWANFPRPKNWGMPTFNAEMPYPKPYPPFFLGPNNFANGNSNGLAPGNGNWGRTPYSNMYNSIGVPPQNHNGDVLDQELFPEQKSKTDLSSMSYEELVHLAANLIPCFSHEDLRQVVQYMLFVNDMSTNNVINHMPQHTQIISEPSSRSSNKTAKIDDKTNKESCKTTENVEIAAEIDWKSHFYQPYAHKYNEELAKFDWETKFAQLCEYKIFHGDFNVTGNPSLCKWIEHQRKLYDNKKLPEDCINRLANVGFWISYPPKSYNDKSSNGDSSCVLNFTKLKTCDTHPPSQFPTDISLHNSESPPKANDNTAKTDVKKAKAKPTKNKNEPAELGPYDEETSKLDWGAHFSQLCTCKCEHGDFNVTGNPSLCKWIEHQRKLYDSKKLPEDCINRLANVGFWKSFPPKGSDNDSSWEVNFAKLEKYVEEKGDCNVPSGLRKWSSQQRNLYLNNQLSKDRIDRLTGIGFWSLTRSRLVPDTLGMTPDEFWEYRFKQMVSYQEKHGTTYVPREDEEHPGLGEWCAKQRLFHRKGQLSEEKTKRLKDVGFGFKKLTSHDPTTEMMSLEEAWDYRFNQLVKYKNEHGNCNVPRRRTDNLPLARWVCFQRESRRKGTLSTDRIEKLSSLDFEWNRQSKSNIR